MRGRNTNRAMQAPMRALMIAPRGQPPTEMPLCGSSHPAMTAPTIPRKISPTSPKSPPFMTRPASQPAMAPTISEIKRASIVKCLPLKSWRMIRSADACIPVSYIRESTRTPTRLTNVSLRRFARIVHAPGSIDGRSSAAQTLSLGEPGLAKPRRIERHLVPIGAKAIGGLPHS